MKLLHFFAIFLSRKDCEKLTKNYEKCRPKAAFWNICELFDFHSMRQIRNPSPSLLLQNFIPWVTPACQDAETASLSPRKLSPISILMNGYFAGLPRFPVRFSRRGIGIFFSITIVSFCIKTIRNNEIYNNNYATSLQPIILIFS